MDADAFAATMKDRLTELKWREAAIGLMAAELTRLGYDKGIGVFRERLRREAEAERRARVRHEAR